MSDVEKDDVSRPKRPYEKPAFVVVALRPEEAVLGACKSSTSAGPGGGGCKSLGSPCSVPGS